MNTRLQAILILVITSTASLLRADDKPAYTYTGEVAGVMCSACSNTVKKSLAKLDGVTSVKVLRAEKEGAPAKLEVTATTATLTKETAVKALGEHAKFYDIRSLTLTSPK